ncbi:MAG: hypothetical protein IT317_05465 [Anaerolineales bacterium]|nr:hypothetical protein [Anaerolineales bacterium]
MPAPDTPALSPLRPGRLAVAAAYLVFAANFAQVVFAPARPERLFWSAGLHLLYLGLYTAAGWQPARWARLQPAYFAGQSLIVTSLLLLDPAIGTVTALFVLLSFQAAFVLSSATRWVWISAFALLTAGPLMLHLGFLTGLARALMPATGCFVLAAYVVANQETEAARRASQAMLAELNNAHQQLQAYAGQVEELTLLEEHTRLARELHASVAQTLFSIVRHTRSAQILLGNEPALARPQLERLQRLTHDALAEMRGLIAQLRPPAG